VPEHYNGEYMMELGLHLLMSFSLGTTLFHYESLRYLSDKEEILRYVSLNAGIAYFIMFI
jgi:hypothetical protein